MPRVPHAWTVPDHALALEVSSRWSRGSGHRGGIVLLHGDGGLGDAIQFCRYAPLIAAAGARVRLVVPDPPVRLPHSLTGVGRISGESEPLPPFDVHCPLMSLPHPFGATLETIPAMVPYLWPRGEAVEAWKTRLAALSGTRVGLVWAAGARSDALRAFTPGRGCARDA